MAHRNKDEWKGSSWQVPVERHEEMMRLIERLGLSSPKQLVMALTLDPELSFEALRPIAQAHVADSMKDKAAREAARQERKALMALTDGMSADKIREARQTLIAGRAGQ